MMELAVVRPWAAAVDKRPSRFPDPHPSHKPSGKSVYVTHRRIKSDRLTAAGWSIWAFADATHSAAAQT